MLKHLPNFLTLLRIGLTGVLLWLLFQPGSPAKTGALVCFLIASGTDYLDGYIARRFSLITDIGKILDPLADKVLVLGAFLVFAMQGIVAGWMVGVIFFREALITVMRARAARNGRIIAAQAAGKLKTVCQMFTIAGILIWIIVAAQAGMDVGRQPLPGVLRVALWTTVAVTVYSGIVYIAPLAVVRKD